MPGPKLAPLLLTDSERASLEALVRKQTASQSLPDAHQPPGQRR
jgi:hypothetical protein